MRRLFPLAIVLAVGLFLLSSWSSSSAQGPHVIQSNCRSDVQKFFPKINHFDAEALKQCLVAQQDKLSASCQAIFPKRRSQIPGRETRPSGV